MDFTMSKMYYNYITKEFGVSFETLKKKYPKISISYGITKLDSWFAYDQVDRPVTNRFQIAEEVAPYFDESINEETKEVILSNGIQRWSIIDKEITEDIIQSAKKELKAKITEKRWMVESGGITFLNGVSVKTSKDDQDRILSVIINAERNGIKEIDFKADSGWVTISIFALKQLAKELTAFVQYCFSAEKLHHSAIDNLSDINDIISYNVNANWDYNGSSKGDSELKTYTISIHDAIYLLYSNFIFPKIEAGKIYVTADRKSDAQSLIDKTYYNVNNLIPSQFYYLLAKTGLDDAIKILLPPLKSADINKYSIYKSYLYGARYYEFSKAYAMYEDIKSKILLVDQSLNFTLEELKELWIEASST